MGFRGLRRSALLTQKDVAERLGVNRTTISMWETGAALPRADLLTRIAALYRCTVDELLGWGTAEKKGGEQDEQRQT